MKRMIILALLLFSATFAARAEAPRPLDTRLASPMPPAPSRLDARAALNPYFKLARCLDEAREYAPLTLTTIVMRPARRGEVETYRTELVRDRVVLAEQAQRCARDF
ncbi:MAG: hypothetical protein ACKO1J_07645 [Tagaea sp.]